jgi:hypothetical protein
VSDSAFEIVKEMPFKDLASEIVKEEEVYSELGACERQPLEFSLKVFSFFGVGFDALASLYEIHFVFIIVDDIISSYHEGSQRCLIAITNNDYSMILYDRLVSLRHRRQGWKNFLFLRLVFHL